MLFMKHNQTVEFLLSVCHVSCPLPGFQIWFIYIFSVLTLLSLHGVDFTRKKLSVSMKRLSQSCTLNRLSYKTLITQNPALSYSYYESITISLKARLCSFWIHYEQQQQQKQISFTVQLWNIWWSVRSVADKAQSTSFFTWPNRVKLNAILKQKYQVNWDWWWLLLTSYYKKTKD